MFEVEKGYSIPVSRNKVAYPWSQMAIGDSFFVPFTVKDPHVVFSAVSVRNGRSHEKFIARQVELGIRVWRVE